MDDVPMSIADNGHYRFPQSGNMVCDIRELRIIPHALLPSGVNPTK